MGICSAVVWHGTGSVRLSWGLTTVGLLFRHSGGRASHYGMQAFTMFILLQPKFKLLMFLGSNFKVLSEKASTGYPKKGFCV